MQFVLRISSTTWDEFTSVALYESSSRIGDRTEWYTALIFLSANRDSEEDLCGSGSEGFLKNDDRCTRLEMGNLWSDMGSEASVVF